MIDEENRKPHPIDPLRGLSHTLRRFPSLTPFVGGILQNIRKPVIYKARLFIFVLALAVHGISCSLIETQNLPPRAIAISSYSEAGTGTPIILDGGKSYDPDGDPIGCIWQELPTNPEPNLIPDREETSFSPDHCVVQITPNAEGEYSFQLRVSDGLHDSQPELLAVTIVDSIVYANPPPVAIAKADRISIFLDQTVTITGEESFDPVGTPLTFSWSESYQNPATGLISPESVTQVVSFPQPGGYLFTLKVWNGADWSLPNSVRINVNSRTNQVPVAEAGLDVNAGYFDEVVLSGGRSYDPDNGGALSYHWTQTGGPPVELSASAGPEELAFMAPDEIMTITFSLVVSDGELESAPDTVYVRIWEHATGNEADAVWVDRNCLHPDSDGSRARPFRFIQDGINAAASYPGPVSDVYVARGSYFEKVTMADGVSVYGGFNPSRNWEHDPAAWPTYLNAVEDTALEIPATVTNLVYVEGLHIRGIPNLPSWFTLGVDCLSSAAIIRRNRIHGGGGENCVGFAKCGAGGIRIQSAAPFIINNTISGGTSPTNNHATWSLDYHETTRPGVWPFIIHNYIDGGGLPDETSSLTTGVRTGTDSRGILVNNIIDPGLGTVEGILGVNKRYGIYEGNGSPSNVGYCPTRECNPVLFHNDIIKNNAQAYLYYDDDGEIKDETVSPPELIRTLEEIGQVNQLGDTSAEDYSVNNIDVEPVFAGLENGDVHQVFDPQNPDDPESTSPLIDAGTAWKTVLVEQCYQMCVLDEVNTVLQCMDFRDQGDYANLCGVWFPWIEHVISGRDFDFDLELRPNCLRGSEENCFDIGPDEVYLYY